MQAGATPQADEHDALARLRRLEAERRRLEADLAAVVGDIERNGLHVPDGHASTRGLLRAEVGWSDGEITQRLRFARLANEHPRVGKALAVGEIAVAHAHLLGRARANPRCGHLLGEHLDLLLDHARTFEYEPFSRCVQRWEQLADVDGAHRDHETCHRNRNATVSVSGNGATVRGEGGSTDGDELRETFERYVNAEFAADWEQTRARWGDDASPAMMPRTDAQRRWDALCRIFRDAVSSPPGSQPPLPTVNILIDLTTYELTLATLGLIPPNTVRDLPEVPFDLRRCETVGGAMVDPVAAVAASFAGHVRRVVFDGAGTVIDLGRRRRLFTGAARDAVHLLAGSCVWPGCWIIAGRCQTDHVHEWGRAGPTDSANGAPLCARHNRWKNHGFTLWRDPNGVWHTYRPDGTEVGRPPPDSG